MLKDFDFFQQEYDRAKIITSDIFFCLVSTIKLLGVGA